MDEIKLIINPDAEEPEAAEVFVDGSVSGKAYRFLLDTGAAKSNIVMDNHTAAFPSAGSDQSSGVFTAMRSDLITIPNIEIGPISKQNVTMSRSGVEGVGRANLIGMDLLKTYCFHFLFNKSRVLVGAESTSEVGEPLTFDKGFHPYIEVGFEASKAKAVWDTGASITVVDQSFIDTHSAFFQPAGHSLGTDASGTTVETPMYVLSQAVIGGYVFPPHKVAAVDLSQVNATIEIPMNLIVGYSTYRYANWIFDFPQKRWTISKWLAG